MKFNKKLAAVGAVLIVSAGIGTATVLDFFGETQGDIDVENAALEVKGQQQGTVAKDVPGTYQLVDMSSEENYNYLELTPNVDQITVNLQATYSEAGTEDYTQAVDGVTSHYLTYEVPGYNTSSDIVVDADNNQEDNHYATIQEAVDAANGETVYVEPGNYSGFEPGDNASVVSTDGPGQTEIYLNDKTIDTTGGDLTIKGFKITGTGEEGSEGKEGAVAHFTPGNGAGTLMVKDNIFDGQFDYRSVWAQNTEDAEITGNFFTGESTDAGIEFNADSNVNSATLTVEQNTFAGLADKGLALRAEADRTDSIEIRNNNFVSNSNSGIQAGWSELKSTYDHASFTADSNYFNHTGTKVVDNTDSGIDNSLLNEADNPQTDSTETINRETRLFQVTYLDTALEAGEYGLQTKIAPVR